MLSVCGDFHFIEFMTNSKSGEWFYYSGDAKYLIKTMSKEESKFMRKLLPHYFNFLRENPHTFINPFFGMHRVQMSSFGQQVCSSVEHVSRSDAPYAYGHGHDRNHDHACLYTLPCPTLP